MRIWLHSIAAASLALGFAGCGGPQGPAPETPKPASEAPAPAAAPAPLPRTAAPAGARVSFVTPADGATVKSPVKVQFALEGMELAPAGTFQPNTGHHHLLIDTGLPDAMDQPIIKDEKHLHYGLIQTQAEVSLPPGQHTLQLLLGDGNHIPHDPPVASQQITITVE